MQFLSKISLTCPLTTNARGETRVETLTDAYRVFTVATGERQQRLIAMHNDGETKRRQFIAEHGDVLVQWDDQSKVWRVPAFKYERKRYATVKAADCSRWGCE